MLLIVSFLGELLGTATVAINYYNGAQVAREVKRSLADEANEFRRSPLMASLKDQGPAYFEHEEVRDRLRVTQERFADQVSPRWFLTAGLIALAIGSIAGFLAGLINVL